MINDIKAVIVRIEMFSYCSSKYLIIIIAKIKYLYKYLK